MGVKRKEWNQDFNNRLQNPGQCPGYKASLLREGTDIILGSLEQLGVRTGGFVGLTITADVAYGTLANPLKTIQVHSGAAIILFSFLPTFLPRSSTCLYFPTLTFSECISHFRVMFLKCVLLLPPWKVEMSFKETYQMHLLQLIHTLGYTWEFLTVSFEICVKIPLLICTYAFITPWTIHLNGTHREIGFLYDP